MIDFSENMVRSIAMLRFLVIAFLLVAGFLVLKYLVHVILAVLFLAVALFVLAACLRTKKLLDQEASRDHTH